MRIAVATDQWSPDVIGGSARVARATAQQFARLGHDVTVVSPRAGAGPGVERDGGVELHRSIRRGRLPQTFTDVLETWRWAVRRSRPDVFVAHQSTTAVGLIAAHPSVPLVYVFHASAPLEQRFVRRRSRPLRRIPNLLLDPSLVLLEAIAIRRAAAITVLSEYSRDLLLARHPSAVDRVLVVRGGVEFERFSSGDGPRARQAYGVPNDLPFVLTVRRLEPRMGVEELLRATQILIRSGVRLTVGVAGAGMTGRGLKDLSRKLGLEPHVRFFGRVPDEDLPGLYAAADVFVLPTVAYEGFGMSTIEALAAGTPVVGTSVGATPEILRPLDRRLLAPSAQPQALAATIEQTLEGTSLEQRRRCADYAYSQFRWEEAIESWTAAVQKAAQKNT
ncbi:MAG: glycosyltransferase family 4 protein [Gaiellaceae bacterium]